MKNENLVVKAKEDVVFYQCGSSGEGYASLTKFHAKKGDIFLASAALKKDFPDDKFEILEIVELKKDSDVCPCCVSDVKYFDVNLSKYQNIIHINQLKSESVGWVPYSKTHQYLIVRGRDMIPQE